MSRWINVLYRGGRVSVELVEIDASGHELEAKAATAWRLMKLAADLDGVVLEARTAWRSYEFQAELRAKYEAYAAYLEKVKLWNAGGKVGPEPARVQWAALANKPGTSTHEIGNAVDIAGANQEGGAINNWLNENSKRFGWKRTVPSELWHYNYSPV